MTMPLDTTEGRRLFGVDPHGYSAGLSGGRLQPLELLDLTLTLSGQEVGTVFDLIGANGSDLTYRLD